MSAASDFIHRCLSDRPADLPPARAVSAALLAWSAGTGRDGFLRICTDPSNEGRRAFDLAVRSLRDGWTAGGTVVAFWIPHTSPFVNQLSPIAQAVRSDHRFRTVSVATGDFEPDQIGMLEGFLDAGFLHSPDLGWVGSLDFVQVMVASEGNLDASGFPRHVRRAALPHALRDPLRSSMTNFAVGAVFDHVLAAGLSPEYLADLDGDPLIDLWPPDLVEHASRELVVVPAGAPKLDRFVRAVEEWKGPVRDIVYHLSMWGLETEFVHKNARSMVSLLLDAFPDRNVVFRPFPKEAGFPAIERIARDHGGNPRFRMSLSASYVEDYASAAILVHHRSSSAELFALATGRPVLQVVGAGEHVGNPYGIRLEGSEGLVESVRSLLEAPPTEDTKALGSFLANPGRATAAVLDALETIGRGGRGADWKTIPLHSERLPATPTERFLLSGTKAFRLRVPARILGRGMARRFPDSFTFNFLAAAAILNDGHPGFHPLYGPVWLDALECAARCFRLEPDPPVGQLLAPAFDEWLREKLPELVTCLLGYFRSEGTPSEKKRFEACLELLPLAPGPGSIPARLLKLGNDHRRADEERIAAIDSLGAEVAHLRLEAGIAAMERNRPAEAREHFQRGVQLRPRDPSPWVGLAHAALALGDRTAFQEAVAKLESDPATADAAAGLRARARA